MNGLLLDTHTLVWIFEGLRIGDAARTMIERTWSAGDHIFVSPISAWEIGMLTAKGRITLSTDPARWIARLLATPSVKLSEMSPALLIEASYLPAPLHKDPADRILVATARHHDLTLITRDRMLLAYAKAGHLRAVAC